MIISLFSGATLRVTEEMAHKVDRAMVAEVVPQTIRISLENGDKATVVVSTINGIWSPEQWERMEHEKVGDWDCKSGHWHRKAETFCHAPSKNESLEAAPWLRESPKDNPSTDRERWMRLIQINMGHGKVKGNFGKLRTLEDLDHFDRTGEMPELVKTEEITDDKKVMQTTKTSEVFPGAKVE